MPVVLDVLTRYPRAPKDVTVASSTRWAAP
jgi:hypothetical protein